MDPLAASSKKKASNPNVQACAHCLAVLGHDGVAILACARCGLVAYCSRDYQRVYWKANQKAFCIAKANRAPPLAAPCAKEKFP